MHDGAGDAPQPVGVTQQLALVQPGAVDEVVVLDARRPARSDSPKPAAKSASGSSFDGAALPGAPGTRRPDADCRIVAGEAFVVGRDHVAALSSGIGATKPSIDRDISETPELVVPVEFRPGDGIDPAQDQLADPPGMVSGIGQRQRRTPGAAKHLPSVHAGQFAQAPMSATRCQVVFRPQSRMGGGAPAAALVEEHHVVAGRIEEPRRSGEIPPPGPASVETPPALARVPARLQWMQWPSPTSRWPVS